MSSISASGVQYALADFVDQRVLPALDKESSSTKWILGGAMALLLSRFENVMGEFSPFLKQMGVIDEDGYYDIDAVETFMKSAFEKQNPVRMPVFGINFSFDKNDGEALIAIMRKRGE